MRPSSKTPVEASFAEVLKRETTATSLKFSAHAAQRMKDRNIQLSDADLMRLQDAVVRAQAKGSRESLVMMEKAAFVVSIRNQTVITAVDGEHEAERVYQHRFCRNRVRLGISGGCQHGQDLSEDAL